MSCVICLLDSSADAPMWTCVGCTCTFHAACVGVTVQRNSLRKKDKKIDPTSYILPCCSSCQTLISLNFEIRALTEQQVKLTEIINTNTEVIHRTNHANNAHVVDEMIERCEALLIEAKKEVTTVKSSAAACNLPAIKNHITSIADSALHTFKDNLHSITSEICDNFATLNKDIKELSIVTMSLADKDSLAPLHINPIHELDILDELKKLQTNMLSLRNDEPPPAAVQLYPSLEVELNQKLNDDTSGWRFLGTRKVWKADWTEYDARKSRRIGQQKLAEKASKRRKFMKRNNSASSREFKSSNSIINNQNSKNAYPGLGYHIEHSNSNSNRNNNNTNGTKYSSYNARIAERGVRSSFPSDKDLLTVAKKTFSKPPVADIRGISFQRGETLFPYQHTTQRDTASSSNWTLRPAENQTKQHTPQMDTTSSSNLTLRPALRSSFTNHCTSCSCQRTGF